MTSRDLMSTRVLSIVWISLFVTQLGFSQSTEEIVIGRKQYIDSQILGETREYWVSLPDSYNEGSHANDQYPLLIVLDGRSLFRTVSGTVGFLGARQSIPEMIVVGVVSTNRERDYTPDKIVTRRSNQTGGADNFLSFVGNELLPRIETSLRTSSYKVLVGHSLGGLLAVHAYLQPESDFDAFIAIDPSMGTWDSAKMDEKMDEVADASLDRFLYIATANWGARNLRNRDRHVRLFESLHQRAATRQFRAKLDYFEDETHNSVPLVSFYQGLRSLFEGYGMTYREVISAKQVSSHYEQISNRLNHAFLPPEELVNRAGYRMLRSENESQRLEALMLFELNAENYPNSYNAYDSLGEAFTTVGENYKAIESYRKSLVLNSNNENAKTQLKLLTEQ